MDIIASWLRYAFLVKYSINTARLFPRVNTCNLHYCEKIMTDYILCKPTTEV